jgi:hypothetical protein
MLGRNGRNQAAYLIFFLVLVASPVGLVLGRSLVQGSASVYYVDCVGGNDGNSGVTPDQAWQSLGKANQATLDPGDRLLFKRGCSWSGTLHADWNGTAGQPITIGAYDSGTLPLFQNGPADLADGYHNNVQITGSYLILEYLETKIINPPVDPNCQNNPIGFFVGFNFRNPDNSPNGGSYNILRFSKASHQMAGVHLNTNTHHNRVVQNILVNNHVMDVLTPVGVSASDDIGAWGVLLRGSDHEIAFNYFADNNAWCTYDTPPQGNSVELFEARNNRIHHNTAVNDRHFAEVGGSAAIKSDGNILAYNLVISAVPDARFIILRGGESSWGPTWRTTLYNNTVVLTGTESEALVCGAGCGGDILTARNNIFWAEQKAAFADGSFHESNNLYWSSDGDPLVQFIGFGLDGSSMIANPAFTNVGTQNLRLTAGSPAREAGSAESVAAGFTVDLIQTAVPQVSLVDIGAYEYYPIVYSHWSYLPAVWRP